MSRYAEIDATGHVVNVIILDDPKKFASVNTLIQSDEASIGGTIINGIYTAPERMIYIPTTEDLVNDAQIKISQLLSLATEKITPLQDAVDLGIATEDETTSLTAWKNYRVLVNRVPTQPGYPTEIDWPPTPE